MNCALWCLFAFAPPNADAAAAAKAILPFIDDQTVFVLRARADLLQPGRVTALCAPLASSILTADFAAGMLATESYLHSFRLAKGRDLYLLMSFGDAYLFRPRWAPKLVVPVPDGLNPDKLWRSLSPPPKLKPTIAGNAVAFNAKLRDKPLTEMEPLLAEAFAASGDAPIVALAIITPDHRRVLTETVKPLGGFRWASISLDGPQPVKATVRIDFDNEANAKLVWDALPSLVPAEQLDAYKTMLFSVAKDFNPGKRWTLAFDDASGSLQRIAGKLNDALDAASRAMNRATMKSSS